MAYDSRGETLKHSQRVGELMSDIIKSLIDRSQFHDRSKTMSPEVEYFDVATPKLRGLVYGTAQYSRALEEIQPALDHHYATNRHHPEHFIDGVNGMTLVDLIEMFADWRAATERTSSGNFRRSLDVGFQRFGIDEQLQNILWNTAQEYGWLDTVEPIQTEDPLPID